jgi:predicted nuclease with TOPRIM domain
MIHKSKTKLLELKEKQTLDMKYFEESEMNAIEEKQKRLHYESIRLEETKKDLKDQTESVNEQLSKIEERVFSDTKNE